MSEQDSWAMKTVSLNLKKHLYSSVLTFCPHYVGTIQMQMEHFENALKVFKMWCGRLAFGKWSENNCVVYHQNGIFQFTQLSVRHGLRLSQKISRKPEWALVTILIDLSQEHALESVELCSHLLGEVLQVGWLYHLQTLATQNREENSRGLTFNKSVEKKLSVMLGSRTKMQVTQYSAWNKAIITGEKQTSCKVFIRK